MRGEHALPPPADIVCTGSSPHARGARYELAPRLRRFGIIPACAGSTFSSAMFVSLSAPCGARLGGPCGPSDGLARPRARKKPPPCGMRLDSGMCAGALRRTRLPCGFLRPPPGRKAFRIPV